jgi:excisionase family DNA binding protein
MDASLDNSGENRSAAPALLLTPEQAARSLAICRTKVYELLRNGELESVQIGASRRIPAAALTEYVDRLRTASRTPADAWPQRPTLLRRQRND